MGVYYYFHNETTNTTSKTFEAKFNWTPEDEQIECFKEQIKENGWSDSDIVAALPDNGNDPIKYTNGRIMAMEDTYTWR